MAIVELLGGAARDTVMGGVVAVAEAASSARTQRVLGRPRSSARAIPTSRTVAYPSRSQRDGIGIRTYRPPECEGDRSRSPAGPVPRVVCVDETDAALPPLASQREDSADVPRETTDLLGPQPRSEAPPTDASIDRWGIGRVACAAGT